MSYRLIAAAVLALAPPASTAQTAAKVQPAPAGTPGYDSAFTDYRSNADTDLVPWREANEEMARLNGHVGHLKPEATPPGGVSAPVPAATPKPRMHGSHGGHSGHGGRK